MEIFIVKWKWSPRQGATHCLVRSKDDLLTWRVRIWPSGYPCVWEGERRGLKRGPHSEGSVFFQTYQIYICHLCECQIIPTNMFVIGHPVLREGEHSMPKYREDLRSSFLFHYLKFQSLVPRIKTSFTNRNSQLRTCSGRVFQSRRSPKAHPLCLASHSWGVFDVSRH